ncbi:MAG: hypothetical protein AAF965_04465 [Pseudomonadota bacterium]
MKHFKFCLALGVTLSVATSAIGQNASDFCPADIDAACLEAVADHVISKQPQEAQRQTLALDYAAVLLSKTPDHASRLVQEFSQGADWRSLRRIGNRFADAGQTEQAASLIWAAVEARAQDPNPRAKALDMLLMVEDAADINDLDLARRIHGAIVPHLPGELSGFVPFSEELRLTRLMSLYGWPEDAHTILDQIYGQLPEMPQESLNYGLTLTRLVTVAVLTGHHDLHQKLEADIRALLMRADRQVQNDVQQAHVTALAEAGLIEQAKVLTTKYGLNFDLTIQNVPHLFLTKESEYFPGIAVDTLRRFEAMFAAVENPATQADFLAKLASRMIQDKQYDGLDGLLARVTDQTLRADLVRELIIYHAREREDYQTAADLYFSERPEFVAKFPSLGTFRGQYPLSLTARGLLESGDLERGGEIADEVLKLWQTDQSDGRRLDALLVGALAKIGDNERLGQWYSASDEPRHQMDVLISALRAQVNSGQFQEVSSVQTQLNEMLPLFSDAERDAPVYWPEDQPYPTLREEAAEKLLRLNESIIIALARTDQPSEARRLLEALNNGDVYPWRAQLEVARATARAGENNQASEANRAILDQLLQGGIETRQLPYVVNAMLQ